MGTSQTLYLLLRNRVLLLLLLQVEDNPDAIGAVPISHVQVNVAL